MRQQMVSIPVMSTAFARTTTSPGDPMVASFGWFKWQ
jgi:hypothetical protein